MNTRASLGLLLLLALTVADRARAADKLIVETLSTRLAANPTGADAEALASDD
jgi:hypothetical protein